MVIYLNMILLGFTLFGTLCDFCVWKSISFLSFGKFSNIISSNTFSILFQFSFYKSYKNVIMLFIAPAALSFSSFLFTYLFICFFLFCWMNFIILSSSSLMPSYVSPSRLVMPSSVFFHFDFCMILFLMVFNFIFPC